MSGFSNSVLGGASKLIRSAIQSPNFVSGVSGWSINRDGSAEFDSIVIRGTFNGDDWILTSSGLFFYDGPAGPTTLFLALAAKATTDPYGTAVQQGLALIDPATGVGVRLQGSSMSLPGAGSATVGFLSAQPSTSASKRPQLTISGPADGDLVPQLLLAGESADGTSLAELILQAYSLSAGAGQAITARINGALVATHPGSETRETWQPLSLANSWVRTNTSVPAPSYRLTPDNCVELVADISSGTITNGTTLLTSPLGGSYQTKTTQQVALMIIAGATASENVSPRAYYAGGQLTLQSVPTGTSRIWFHARLPLDL